MQEAKARLNKSNPEITDEAIIKAYYDKHNALELVNRIVDDQKKAVRWYIDCGDDDFLYEGNSLIHIAMRKKDVPHEFRIRDGGHTWTYWRDALPTVLGFVSETFHQK
jgi:S-formylglutathione hydrolase FrmB